MRLLPHIVVAALAAGFASQLSAQTDPCLDRVIPVNVNLERGKALTPSTAANFQASIRGKPIRITSATYDSGPLRIVILIDVSGSMMGGIRQLGLEFAQDLISSAPPQDSLALLTFNERIVDVIPFGQDRTAFREEVDELQHAVGRGRTAIEDALVSALALLKTPSVGDAICLVSDGGENASHTDWFRVKARLVSSGIRLYAFAPIWHRNPNSRTTVEADGLLELRDLAAVTGGDFLQFELGEFGVNIIGKEDFAHVRQGFYSEVFSFIKLSMRLPEPLAKPVHWNLDVVDASGRPNRHAQLHYPQRLAPCTPGEAH
jgi:hypothetical protein